MTSKRWSDELALARAAIHAEPLYGRRSFTPQTRCCEIHPRGIKVGSSEYCENCSVYGRDGFESTYQHPGYDVSGRAEKDDAKAAKEAKAAKDAKAKKSAAKFKPRIKSKQAKKAARLASPGRTHAP